jgi:hypothetical protein
MGGLIRAGGTNGFVLQSFGIAAARSKLGAAFPRPKSDLSDVGQSNVPNSGKPEFGWGEVGSQSDPGGDDRTYRFVRTPSPQPSPRRGKGAL